MPVASFPAPQTPLDGLDAALRDRGFAVLAPDAVAALAGVAPAELDALVPSWDDLRPDHYLKDGGRYRKRRHSCFIAEGEALCQVPHRMHWQSLDYNALHGGMHRMFEPMLPATVALPAWLKLLNFRLPEGEYKFQPYKQPQKDYWRQSRLEAELQQPFRRSGLAQTLADLSPTQSHCRQRWGKKAHPQYHINKHFPKPLPAIGRRNS